MKDFLNRREFGRAAVASTFALLCSGNDFRDRVESFSFVHFTDTHIQPELAADRGCRECFATINRLRPDFALCGGDLVFDASEVQRTRAIDLFNLYLETSKRLAMPVHTVPGNHDLFGLSTTTGIATSDPWYGKRLFEDRIGGRYGSFDHKGWHFILLDSIGITSDRQFIGKVDDEQLSWLKTDLARIGRVRPKVVLTHVPLVSAVMQIVPDPWKTNETYLVTNSREVTDLLWQQNVKAVLQGHTHIRETVLYNGIPFITSGAVCGNWWKGPRLGHPEGFAVITVTGDRMDWRYETYGFVSKSNDSKAHAEEDNLGFYERLCIVT